MFSTGSRSHNSLTDLFSNRSFLYLGSSGCLSRLVNIFCTVLNDSGSFSNAVHAETAVATAPPAVAAADANDPEHIGQ